MFLLLFLQKKKFMKLMAEKKHWNVQNEFKRVNKHYLLFKGGLMLYNTQKHTW